MNAEDSPIQQNECSITQWCNNVYNERMPKPGDKHDRYWYVLRRRYDFVATAVRLWAERESVKLCLEGGYRSFIHDCLIDQIARPTFFQHEYLSGNVNFLSAWDWPRPVPEENRDSYRKYLIKIANAALDYARSDYWKGPFDVELYLSSGCDGEVPHTDLRECSEKPDWYNDEHYRDVKQREAWDFVKSGRNVSDQERREIMSWIIYISGEIAPWSEE